MTHRIREAHLARVVREINETLGVPNEMYSTNIDGTSIRDDNGDLIANVGHVYVDRNDGGYRLERITNGGGAASDIMPKRGTKRDTYDIAMAFLLGLTIAKQ